MEEESTIEDSRFSQSEEYIDDSEDQENTTFQFYRFQDKQPEESHLTLDGKCWFAYSNLDRERWPNHFRPTCQWTLKQPCMRLAHENVWAPCHVIPVPFYE